MTKISKRSKELIFKVVCGAILCCALMLLLLTSGRTVQNLDNPWETNATALFGGALITFGVFELLFFIVKVKENKENKLVYARIVYFTLFFIAAIIAFLSKKFNYLFALSGVIYFLVPISKRIVAMIKNHKPKNLAYNIIFGIILLVMLIITAFCIGQTNYLFFLIAAFVPAISLTVTALFYIFFITLSNFKSHILLKIVRKTYAGEIILGLLLLIIAFSIVLMMTEPNITNFGDALWYCYMLVTTIGFGDFTSVSIIGRILSVVLGIYGIIVVAIVTSIIVNFYNEVKDDDEDEDEKKLEENETKEIEEIIDSSEINPVQTNNTEEE
ncbi:MAG: two pore domain potassium channel family protein [Clostridia bacterium]|nr:two pore domain potassium channel family protein [Clostridia bacterium]